MKKEQNHMKRKTWRTEQAQRLRAWGWNEFLMLFALLMSLFQW